MLVPFVQSYASEGSAKSFHVGIFHPSGVDLIGFTVENKIANEIYWYYTFGIPSLAAIGACYYSNYPGNSFTSTLGVGIGSLMYGSIAYQIQIIRMHYLKFGAGLTASIVYSGVYPVFSYEYRF
jgi:hypothetical protein